jgi:hypothetical protein
LVIKLIDKEIEPKIIRDREVDVEVSFSIEHNPTTLRDWIRANLQPDEVLEFLHLWSNDQAAREYSMADGCLYIRLKK